MKNSILLVFLLLAAQFATADQKLIKLNDGTEIVGEIVSMRNGSYTIRSNSLGTLTISDRQVQQISALTGGTGGLGSQASSPVETGKSALQNGQVQAIQQQLTSDSTMVQRILALQSSPEMQAVLSDPEVMAAVQRLDFEALQNHPKIKRLMSNQKIQAITKGTN